MIATAPFGLINSRMNTNESSISSVEEWHSLLKILDLQDIQKTALANQLETHWTELSLTVREDFESASALQKLRFKPQEKRLNNWVQRQEAMALERFERETNLLFSALPPSTVLAIQSRQFKFIDGLVGAGSLIGAVAAIPFLSSAVTTTGVTILGITFVAGGTAVGPAILGGTAILAAGTFGAHKIVNSIGRKSPLDIVLERANDVRVRNEEAKLAARVFGFGSEKTSSFASIWQAISKSDLDRAK